MNKLILTNDEKKILRIIFYFPLLIIIFLSFLLTIFITLEFKKHTEKNIEEIKNNYTYINKEHIRNRVNDIYEYIIFQKNSSILDLKKQLKKKVMLANSIAMKTYDKNKNLMNNDEIILKIINNLSSISFKNKNITFYGFDVNGKNILSSFSQTSNTIMIDKNNFTRRIKETIENKKETFYEYYQYRNAKNPKEYKKIGFYKYFEPYNIVIGFDEYFIDFENNLKKDILNYINKLNSKSNNYIFIVNHKGKVLAHQKKEYINKNVSNLLDKSVSEKFNEVIKKREGYISYLFPTKDGETHTKTSFLKDLTAWEWLIGIGYDDYKLSKRIEEKKYELEEKKYDQFVIVIISSILITILLMYLTYYFSSKLEKKFIKYKMNLNKKEKEKEKELINSAEIYKNLFESNKSIILLISPKNGDVINANKSACEFYGYSRTKLLSLKISDINILTEEECQKEIDAVVDNKRAYFNFIHKLSNGTKKNVRVYTSISNYLGMPILYSTIQDVTNEYKAKDELLETENEFKALFEFSNIGLGIRDINANFIKVNKKLIDMLGYDKNFLLNKTCSHISYNENENEELELFKSLLNKEIVNYSIEKSFIKKDGTKFDALLTMASIFNNKGEIVQLLSSIIDISEIKKKDNLLFQQSKMAAMGEMIANIAHQWRQPLSIISTISTSIKLKSELNILERDELHESMDDLNEATQHLSETIDDFRNFYKENKYNEKFNILSTFEKTFKLIEAKFKTSEVYFIKKINDISLVGQENELIQVLINIFNNALDEFIKKENIKRFIFIDVIKNHDKSLEIYIKDNAGGIPLNIIDNIFDSLFTTKEATNGTGIGLYMSKMIIEEHMHGKLNVKNVEFNYEDNFYKGAEFNISIPMETLYDEEIDL